MKISRKFESCPKQDIIKYLINNIFNRYEDIEYKK